MTAAASVSQTALGSGCERRGRKVIIHYLAPVSRTGATVEARFVSARELVLVLGLRSCVTSLQCPPHVHFCSHGGRFGNIRHLQRASRQLLSAGRDGGGPLSGYLPQKPIKRKNGAES